MQEKRKAYYLINYLIGFFLNDSKHIEINFFIKYNYFN